MKASVKVKRGLKWETLDYEVCIGKSIAELMYESKEIMVGALLDDKNVPVLFITNDKDQYYIYKAKALTLMVEDLILLLGQETIPNNELTKACLEVFPDGKFEVKEINDKGKWW